MTEYIDSIHPVGIWKNTDPIDLRQQRTRPVLLYFWQAHSSPSVETLHELNQLCDRHGGEFPLDVIAIHAPEFEDDDTWEELLDHFKIELPVFHDQNYGTWEHFDVQHAPTYIVLDEKGDEVLRRVGMLHDSGVHDYIHSLMNE